DDCRREAEAIGGVAALLSSELASEPSPEWNVVQQRAVEAALADRSARKPSWLHVLREHRFARRALVFGGAAVVLICFWLIAASFVGSGPGTVAMAQTWEQIQQAKSITWTLTFYSHATGVDGS